MRLQRALARAGVASRRRAEELIEAGQVRVNGVTAVLGQSVDPDADTITVRGRVVRPAAPVWIALNKPAGYVVTQDDPRGRPTVFDLVPAVPGLTYVGRLDVATVGLLLMTNQGDAIFRLTHPRYQVPRTYRVWVTGCAAKELQHRLEKPVVIDGRPVALANWTVRAQKGDKIVVTLTLTEGRYRIVRRLCKRLGVRVDRLVRMSHGPVGLGPLKPGSWRHLTPKETRAIERVTAA